MYIDTHCHLNLLSKQIGQDRLTEESFNKISIIYNEAIEKNVSKIITVGTNYDESRNCVDIATKYNGVYSAIGLHPCDAKENWKDEIIKIEELLEHKVTGKIVAIGEVGLDFYHKPFNLERQYKVFQRQIEIAIDNKLPLIIHTRDSLRETYEVLNCYKNNDLRGVIHCFSGNIEMAKKFLDYGFYLGFGGTITYPKNNELRDVVNYVPLESILLETDAPFLPPQLYRGKTNYPKYIPIFAEYVSKIKDKDIKEVEAVIEQNSIELFKL